jgi:hypothetical protein
MNDFQELENELRALRPTRPSPVLFERIEEAMVENCRASAAADAGLMAKWFRRFAEWSRGDASDIDGQLVRERERGRASQTPYRIGFGLVAAAAAVVLLLVRINTDQTRNKDKEIAQVAPASETRPVVPAFSGGRGVDGSLSSNKFVPAGAMQVVYNTRDEGLQFADGSRQPLRRLRYQTQQTWKWRNPSTGASLRVSYPSEEVVLIPVSGQ